MPCGCMKAKLSKSLHAEKLQAMQQKRENINPPMKKIESSTPKKMTLAEFEKMMKKKS